MTHCPKSTYCRLTMHSAQLVGIGVATRCKSDLKGLHSHRSILFLTRRFVDLNLVRVQWGPPFLVPAALFRIQSP